MTRYMRADDLGLVNALEYGLEMDSQTLLSAIAAIGPAQHLLALLPYGQFTDWTVDAPVCIPRNIAVILAPVVRVVGTAQLTIQGTLVTYGSEWYQGTGGVLLTGGWTRLFS